VAHRRCGKTVACAQGLIDKPPSPNGRLVFKHATLLT
jgi:hypothetical protein